MVNTLVGGPSLCELVLGNNSRWRRGRMGSKFVCLSVGSILGWRGWIDSQSPVARDIPPGAFPRLAGSFPDWARVLPAVVNLEIYSYSH